MKVYVDELPKSCRDCPFYKLDTYVDIAGYTTNSYECVLDGSMLTNSCPLQSLTDYTKQVRKEVREEIRDLAGNYFELPYCDNCGETNNDDVVLTGNDLTEILDQIQGETNGDR